LLKSNVIQTQFQSVVYIYPSELDHPPGNNYNLIIFLFYLVNWDVLLPNVNVEYLSYIPDLSFLDNVPSGSLIGKTT